LPNYKFIINPYSGRGNGAKVAGEIEKILREKKIDFEMELTTKPKEATEIAKKSAEKFEVVVAVGGDGTFHEVVKGLVGTKAMLGLMPVGSGNDFAKMFNIDTDIYKSIEILQNGKTKLIDLGKCNDEYFDNSVGIGFDAVVTYESYKIKKLRGMAIYLSAVIKTTFTYKSPKVEIIYNGKKLHKKAFMITIGNGTRQGGGFYITPDAKIDDGLLDICIIDNLSKMQVFQHLPKTLDGSHTGLKEVTMDKTDKIIIESEDNLPVHCDGEILGMNLHKIEIEVIPKILKVIGDV
jgi:YegS/Rv2252/BmrU family lipid kinase